VGIRDVRRKVRRYAVLPQPLTAREPFKGLDCNDIDNCLCCFIAAETTRVVSARGDMELCSSPPSN